MKLKSRVFFIHSVEIECVSRDNIPDFVEGFRRIILASGHLLALKRSEASIGEQKFSFRSRTASLKDAISPSFQLRPMKTCRKKFQVNVKPSDILQNIFYNFNSYRRHTLRALSRFPYGTIVYVLFHSSVIEFIRFTRIFPL